MAHVLSEPSLFMRPERAPPVCAEPAPAPAPPSPPARRVRVSDPCTSDARTDQLLRTLEQMQRDMRADGVQYADEYVAAALDAADFRFWKMYLINAGHPEETPRPRVRAKTRSAYVGCSRQSAASRLAHYNAAVPRALAAAGARWRLFVVLFFPPEWSHEALEVALQYLRSAHGLDGKLARFADISRRFALRRFVPADAADYVRRREAPV